MDEPDPRLVGFLASQKDYDDFREYMKHLLSTFLPEKYLSIYMDENPRKPMPRPKEYQTFPKLEVEPLGIDEDQKAGLGPFYVIRRAFTHEFVSSINLETLETLGDAVLNEAVVMIITTAWPNLLTEAGQVTDMKKFYTNNTSAAKYAEKLGFFRWVVRLKTQGLNSKERADVFESFVGALVMIGEFYIGEQMGLAIGRLFLNKFLSQEKWYPEDPKFYETPANLWNDFGTSLPPDIPKPKIIRKETRQDSEEEGGTGLWYFALTIADPIGKEGLVFQRTKSHIKTFSASARSKDDAKTAVYKELAIAMKLSRGEINIWREKKREKDLALHESLKRLEKYGEETGRTFQVPAKKPRGGQIFVFVEEIKKVEVNGRELTITQTVASGMGKDETSALNEAVDNLTIRRRAFKPVAGTDFKIQNPDKELITMEESERSREEDEKPCPTCGREKETEAKTGERAPRSFVPKTAGRGRGRGRGNTPHPRQQDYSAFEPRSYK